MGHMIEIFTVQYNGYTHAVGSRLFYSLDAAKKYIEEINKPNQP